MSSDQVLLGLNTKEIKNEISSKNNNVKKKKTIVTKFQTVFYARYLHQKKIIIVGKYCICDCFSVLPLNQVGNNVTFTGRLVFICTRKSELNPLSFFPLFCGGTVNTAGPGGKPSLSSVRCSSSFWRISRCFQTRQVRGEASTRHPNQISELGRILPSLFRNEPRSVCLSKYYSGTDLDSLVHPTTTQEWTPICWTPTH